jgi:hypothetical protein
MTPNAHIHGKVECRQGDGATMTIPTGPCEVKQTAQDATLSWEDGETHLNAAMPLSDFKRYLASNAIRMLDTVPAA